jgi:hypothetical protein
MALAVIGLYGELATQTTSDARYRRDFPKCMRASQRAW